MTGVLLAVFAAAVSSSPAPPARVKPRLTMPPLQARLRTLPNGLKVVSLADASSPTVSVQVYYQVGSVDDPDQRSGFAHLFEHLMFKATKNMKSEMMDRLTEDVGGFNNASTGDDVTRYYEVVPAHYLETLLWAEADRMATLQVDEAAFKSERDVVKEEFRSRVLAPPYGKLFYAMETRSFTVHPYRRPGIGSIEDLDAATLEDVRAFHRTFYRPDNATLIVVGDFDPAKLDEWVDRYFSKVPKPDLPLPRVTAVEPPREGEKRFSETGANVPLPAVLVTYLVPPVTHPDAEPLRVLEALLASGDSSRLHRTLVYEKQLASRVAAGADLRLQPGLFYAFGIAASGHGADEVEKGLLAELERMKQTPVTAQELEKAKNQLLHDLLAQRETASGKARALAEAVVFYGDADRANTDLARLQAVSAADVARVARQYLTEKNRVVIGYAQEASK